MLKLKFDSKTGEIVRPAFDAESFPDLEGDFILVSIKEWELKQKYQTLKVDIKTLTLTHDFSENKSGKFDEISLAHDSAIANGKFLSTALEIDIDCRRSETKNDYQNVVGLLSLMQRNGVKAENYKGVTDIVPATQDQIQALIYEMEEYVAGLYKKKRALEARVEKATTSEELDSISW